MAAELLRVDNLSAGYGNLRILFGVNVAVPRGSLTCIIGPNGSGKSTLLKSVVGLASVQDGEVLLAGRSLVGMKPYQIAKMGVAYLPQTNNIFTKLTVDENLRMAVHMLPKKETGKRCEEAYSFFKELSPMKSRQAGTLSGGERQILSMAMAFVRHADLLLLDEPTAALAPRIAAQIFGKIVKMNEELGTTILLVEQNARKALEVCDKAYLLVAGQKAFEGTARELLENKELAKLYLGLKTT